MTQEHEEQLYKLLSEKRQELWVGFHNSQEWSKQKEAVKPIDDLINTLFLKKKEIKD